MLLLGLLLLGATAAFTGLVIADNLSGGPEYSVVLLGNTIATMNGLAIFLSGVALALIFCLGLAMTGAGGRLARRRRIALREARSAAPAPAAEPVAEARTVPAADVPAMETPPEKSAPAHAGPSSRRHLFGH